MGNDVLLPAKWANSVNKDLYEDDTPHTQHQVSMLTKHMPFEGLVLGRRKPCNHSERSQLILTLSAHSLDHLCCLGPWRDQMSCGDWIRDVSGIGQMQAG